MMDLGAGEWQPCRDAESHVGAVPSTTAATVTAVDVVLWTVSGLMGLLAIVCALAALGLPLERVGRIGVEVAEAGMLLVVAADLLAWAAGNAPEETFTHVGYVVAAVALIPILTRRPKVEGETEPEPPSMWVLAIAALAVAVVLWRLGVTG